MQDLAIQNQFCRLRYNFFERQILFKDMSYFLHSTFLLIILLTLPQTVENQICNNPCLTCTTNGSSYCASCYPQNVLGPYGVCYPVTCQVLYCSICQIGSPSICLACLPTFINTKNTSCTCQTGFSPIPYGSPAATCLCNSTNCTSCPISGCVTCTNGSACSTCTTGTVMTTKSGCITCSMSNCQSCLVNNFCMTCNGNNTVTIDGFCTICQPNCLVCASNSTFCSICAPGYSLTNGVTAGGYFVINCNTLCNVSYCILCSTTNICKICAYGYISTVGGICINNVSAPALPFPCTQVYISYPMVVCQACNPIYFSYYPGPLHTCIVCNVPNCQACNTGNTSQCTICINNFFLINGYCVLYIALNCTTTSNDLTQCVNCNNYFTSINGICYPCTTPGCILCSANNTAVCITCQKGTYLSSSTCLPCQPYCVSCTNSTSCLLYSSSALIVNSQYTYAVCSTSCLTCSPQNPVACSSCKPGFYFSSYLGSGICLPCNPSSNCKNCSNTNPSQCIACLNLGYLQIVNGTAICQYCISPCSTCLQTNLNSCLTCVAGYFLNGTQCIQNNCSQNCAYCASNSSCLICMSGYFPYQGNGTCLPGIPGCIVSIPITPFVCTGCAPGNGLNPYTSTCFQCPLNCLTCSSTSVCQICQPGYNLTSSGQIQCSPNCLLPCATCQASNSSYCLTCLAGYNSNGNGTCSPITNCLSCVVCPIGYSFSATQTCIACGANCATCYASTPSVCTSCVIGQWLNNSTCISCPTNCVSCINMNSCNYCQPGFYLSGWSVASGQSSGVNTCLQCQTPCFTCTNFNYFCQSCIAGYTLIGNECLNNYNYQFNIVFNSTGNSFNLGYPNVVQALLSTIGTQNQANLFVSAYVSSDTATLYSGQLASQCSSQNATCVNQETNNINSLLHSSTIGGLPVISSSMTSSGGLNTTQNCKSPCSTCTTAGGSICTTCIMGYSVVQGNCVPDSCPVPYCKTCTTGGICIQCLPTFTIVGNTCKCQTGFIPSTTSSSSAFCMCSVGVNSTSSNITCKFCQILNCQTCGSSNCSTCFSGYTSINNGASCVFCSSSCSNCLAQGVCGNCIANYSMSSTSTCVLCNNVTVGCAVCSADNVCASCISGYSPIQNNTNGTNNTLCFVCTNLNCISCNATNICMQCANGYSLSNNTCISNTIIQLNCPLPCIQCQVNNVCSQCIMYLYSMLPNNNTCFMCNVQFCLICPYGNPSNCTQCVQNYMLVQGSSGGYCVLSAYYGCSSINSTSNTCSYCKTYYQFQGNYCSPCNTGVQGCISCASNLTTCNSCQYGMYLNNGVCSLCSSFCLSCNNSICVPNTQVIVVNQQQYLSPCFSPCTQCNGAYPYVCNQCSNGYFLQNSTCISCTAGCKVCSPSNPAQCNSCYQQQLLTANSSCITCTSPCYTCTVSPTNCTSCLNNYQLFNNTCINYTIPSINFCYSWTDNGCAICYPGYVLINSTANCIASGNCPSPYYECYPGMPGCASSAPGSPFVCEVCDGGLVLNPSTNLCIQCPINCQLCSLDLVCSYCYDGFYLTGNSQTPCAPNCIYPCATCSFTNASVCLSCLAGYTFSALTNNQCTRNDIGCTPCSVCPGGYGLNTNSSCVPCNVALSCLACAKGLPNNCISCYPGYFLNSSFGCSQCPTGCAFCNSYSACTQCSAGYYNMQSLQSNNEISPNCQPCGVTCAICLFSPSQCFSCISGYTLLGTQCIRNFNYYFNFTLNTTLNTFNQNYLSLGNLFQNQLESSITSATTNPRQLFITQAQVTNQNLSIFVVGYMPSGCDSGTSCANAEYLRVQSLFTPGSILNMTYLSYYLVQVGSTPYSYNTTNNSTNNQTKNQTIPIVFNCTTPCLSCNFSQGACVTCPLGYQIINGNCLPNTCSVIYCQNCSANNSAICQKCNPSFILNNGLCVCQQGFIPSPAGSNSAICTCQNSACVTCNIQNCLSCNQSNICTSCNAPYILNSQGNCVLCNINNCLNCQSSNYCSTCALSFSVSVNGDQCIVCNLTNCLYCSSMLSCSVCQPGYVFNFQNVACISCNVSNCLTCQGNNVCSDCATNYILTTNFTCTLSTCLYPCSTCNANGSCLTCITPYFQPLPSNGQCYSCNVANCLTCGFNSQTCSLCQDGYTLSNNNTQCSDNCVIVGCSSCNMSQCATCSSMYALSQGTCISCAPGCATCSSTNVSSCNTCITGFYINGATCVACPSYCNDCQSPQTCNQQQSGQSLVLIDNQVYLASCDQGCQQCSSVNPTVCLQCQSGYYLNQNICLPCSQSSNCMVCSSSNPQQCISCFPNTYLTALNGVNVCSTCTSPCVSCQQNQLNACLSCPSGYLLQNNSCLPAQCPLYCVSCSSQQNCLQCVSGFAAVNGNCLPCITGCSVCSVSSPGICIQCSQGTYLDSVSQQCLGCSTSCQSCQASGCVTCYQGYYLTSNLTCAPNCIFPCATCQTTNPSTCLSCQVGYSYTATNIQNCQGNTSCSSTFNCVSCPTGYVLTSQLQCQQCNSICARCVVGSPSTCTSCASNQYLNSQSQCINCPSNCISCLSASVCVQCANGYTSINSPTNNSPALCAACASPCSTCVNSPNNCLSCISTYSLQNAKCISNFNFGFNVILLATSTQFYQNYQAFISSLTSNVEGNAGFVNLYTINSGSVNVTGLLSTLATPQSQNSNNQYNSLLNSLSSNSKIGGMQVASSKVSSNGGNPQYTPSSSSGDSKTTIIIIAVTVPLAILLIIGVGVFFYIRKKRRAELELQMSAEQGGFELKANLY